MKLVGVSAYLHGGCTSPNGISTSIAKGLDHCAICTWPFQCSNLITLLDIFAMPHLFR